MVTFYFGGTFIVSRVVWGFWLAVCIKCVVVRATACTVGTEAELKFGAYRSRCDRGGIGQSLWA